MGSGLSRAIWGRWWCGQDGAIHHSSQSLKSASTLAYSLGWSTPICWSHSQRHDPHAHSRELGLSPEADELPTQPGNKDATSEGRATVGDKERSEMGVRSGEAGEGGSQSRAFRDGSQRGNRGGREESEIGPDWGVTRMRQLLWRLPNYARGFRSCFQMTPAPAPATMSSSPKASLLCPRALWGTASSRHQRSRACRADWPESSPGPWASQVSGRSQAQWGSAPELGMAVGEGWGPLPHCTTVHMLQAEQGPFLFAPCPWPEMNKTPGVGGAIHGTRECVSRPAAPSH